MRRSRMTQKAMMIVAPLIATSPPRRIIRHHLGLRISVLKCFFWKIWMKSRNTKNGWTRWRLNSNLKSIIQSSQLHTLLRLLSEPIILELINKSFRGCLVNFYSIFLSSYKIQYKHKFIIHSSSITRMHNSNESDLMLLPQHFTSGFPGAGMWRPTDLETLYTKRGWARGILVHTLIQWMTIPETDKMTLNPHPLVDNCADRNKLRRQYQDHRVVIGESF